MRSGFAPHACSIRGLRRHFLQAITFQLLAVVDRRGERIAIGRRRIDLATSLSLARAEGMGATIWAPGFGEPSFALVSRTSPQMPRAASGVLWGSPTVLAFVMLPLPWPAGRNGPPKGPVACALLR
jgi:hypothetical protein